MGGGKGCWGVSEWVIANMCVCVCVARLYCGWARISRTSMLITLLFDWLWVGIRKSCADLGCWCWRDWFDNYLSRISKRDRSRFMQGRGYDWGEGKEKVEEWLDDTEGIDGSYVALWYFSGSERIAHASELEVGTVCRFFFCVWYNIIWVMEFGDLRSALFLVWGRKCAPALCDDVCVVCCWIWRSDVVVLFTWSAGGRVDTV